MPTLAEFDAKRKGARAPSAAPSPAEGRYQPGLNDDYGTAAGKELLRTGKEAAIGLARSPLDALKGLLGLPKQVVSGLFGPEGLPALVQDPSLLMEAPAAAKAGANYIGNNPREGGSLLGQMLIGKYAPEIGGAAVEGVKAIPDGMVTAGDAMTRGGQALKTAGGVSVGGVHVPLSTIGLAEAALRSDPKGLALAATPYALEYGGKGLSAAGRGLQKLRGPKAEPPAWDPAGPSIRAKAQRAQQGARETASGDPLMTEPNAVEVSDPGYTNEPVYGTPKPFDSSAPGPSGLSPDDVGVIRDLEGSGFAPGAVKKIGGATTEGLAEFTRRAQQREGAPAPPSALPANMLEQLGTRSAEMGDQTLNTLRAGKYDVPNRGGIRSTQDIDRIASGPIEVDLTDQLDSLGGEPAPAPLTDMEKLVARTRERYGRRFTPEYR